jgi:antirestriction protein ArdC
LKALDITWTKETTGAYFNPTNGKVNIPPARCFMERNGQSATSAYYIVIFHEVVHWTMSHLKRRAGSFGAYYAREELVAELGAIMLMRHFDLDIGNEQRHALYFQTWLGRALGSDFTKDQALEYAKVEAERAVRFILEHGTIGK